ncbi:MAG TPA: hypothetical protein VLK28_10705 [Methylomirabilota bacterium]|nr:hypothetical protein [Methylomirabilota bacterium]
MSARRLLGGAVAAAALAALAAGAAGGERHAGTVLAVDPQARSLVVDEFGANAERRALRVEVPPEALVLLSQRNPSGRELGEAFRDRTVTLADVRVGDFVVVELSGDPEVARLVMITLRRGAGS